MFFRNMIPPKLNNNKFKKNNEFSRQTKINSKVPYGYLFIILLNFTLTCTNKRKKKFQ